MAPGGICPWSSRETCSTWPSHQRRAEFDQTRMLSPRMNWPSIPPGEPAAPAANEIGDTGGSVSCGPAAMMGFAPTTRWPPCCCPGSRARNLLLAPGWSPPSKLAWSEANTAGRPCSSGSRSAWSARSGIAPRRSARSLASAAAKPPPAVIGVAAPGAADARGAGSASMWVSWRLGLLTFAEAALVSTAALGAISAAQAPLFQPANSGPERHGCRLAMLLNWE